MQSAQLKKTSPDSGVTRTESKVSGWPNIRSEVIVDSQDKEAWPSIGDKSDAASDGDNDSASVKSVISSSSIPSQGHGDGQGPSQGSSNMQSQNQSSSNLWSPTMTSNSSESTLDSDNTWGIAPTTSINSAMWDSSSDSKPAGSNPGNGIQAMPNGISTSASGTNVRGSTQNSSGGWGDSLPGEGQFAGNNTSGAQNEQTSVPGSGQSNSFGSAMWQGIRSMSGALSDLDNKETTSQASTGWGTQSRSGSGFGSGLSISASPGSTFNEKGVSVMNQDSSVGQWGPSSTASPANTVWGTTNNNSGTSAGFETKSEGWGSPCPSPISNAGTEGWGGHSSQKAPQAWQQSTVSNAGWDQPAERRPSSSAWDQPPPASTSTTERSTWGDPPKPDNWGSDANRPAPSAWGPPADNKSSSNQWGSAGASGPSQWPGSSASQPNGNNDKR